MKLKILTTYTYPVFFAVFSFSLENVSKSSSEMSTNCQEAAIAKNRQEGAKRQNERTCGTFRVKIWKIRVF